MNSTNTTRMLPTLDSCKRQKSMAMVSKLGMVAHMLLRSLDMKIKITQKMHGWRDRQVFVIATNGEAVPIGTAFYRKISGWYGGGQSWTFHPNDDLQSIRVRGDTKAEMVTKLKAALTVYIRSTNPSEVLTHTSPIINKYIL